MRVKGLRIVNVNLEMVSRRLDTYLKDIILQKTYERLMNYIQKIHDKVLDECNV